MTYSASWDKTIRVWNLETHECEKVLTHHKGKREESAGREESKRVREKREERKRKRREEEVKRRA